jgi:hypothetical protein
MAQIEALLFCYLTISFKGFLKNTAIFCERSSGDNNPESLKRNEAVLQYPELGLLLLPPLYKQRLTAVTINHSHMELVTHLRLSLQF